ncbi:flagellar hook-length control protein FliK [Luteimonas sp. R10]|uniref:flagellar hook-length control protein FliK n=1 Tax=Luteimonas sp. R10 TaxID=3108176 RepID=UPI00308C57AA|nr:flagellar hook-length control protein FliK [Luteimonas sp. R10]
MNMPGFDPAVQPSTSPARGPGARRDAGGDDAAGPFAGMIDRGPDQRWSAGNGAGEARQRPHDPDRGTDAAARPPAEGREGAAVEHERSDEPGGDAPAFAANAAQPWPPQGLAALGLAALVSPGTAQAAAEAGPDAGAAAWSQLAATAAGSDGEAAATPARAITAPGALAGAAIQAAATATAREQPTAQAPVAEPAVPPAAEPLVLAVARSDGEAPPPAFLVAPAAPAQAPREAPAVLAPPLTPTPDLHRDDFAEAVGTRLHWLADQKIGHAQIRINPHDLGPIEVRLRLDGDRVSADFTSAQLEVRQALEASLPRLRDMLGAQGLQLAHADVGQQARQDGAAAQQARGIGGGTVPGEDGAPQPAALAARGLLDAYA